MITKVKWTRRGGFGLRLRIFVLGGNRLVDPQPFADSDYQRKLHPTYSTLSIHLQTVKSISGLEPAYLILRAQFLSLNQRG